MNYFDENRFRNELLQAKEIYFSWPKEIFCPALNSKVRITRTGWDHLVGKKRRSKKQSYFRSKNLAQAKIIIEKINFYQGEKIQYQEFGNIFYWSLQAVVDRTVIEVVIRQIGNQPKHFFSLVYKGGVPSEITKKGP